MDLNSLDCHYLPLTLKKKYYLPDINQQLLIMEMFLITLVSRVVYRKRYDDLELPEGSDLETKGNEENNGVNVEGSIL